MLGNIIIEAAGKVENRRIVSIEGGIPQIEVTVSQTGTICAAEVSILITYLNFPNADETIYTEGNGVIMTKDGNANPLTWTGQGVAKITGQISKNVGSIFFNTTTNKKLSFLNNSVGVFEYFDEDHGNVRGTIWEWK